MDDAIPGQVDLGCIRKVVEPGRGSKPVKQGSSMVFASIPASVFLH